MSWSTVLSYIKALPDGIELTDDKNNVVINPEAGESIVLSVEESHRLIVNAIKSVPSTETVKFLNEYLKENASDLSDDEIANLPEHLSIKMNGLHLTVEIPKSLTETLLAAKGGTYDPANSVNEHKLSVVLQIPKPGQTVYEATGSNVTKQIPFLKYNNPDQFSIAFKLEELNETVFEGNINDVEALLALVVALKCQPTSWRRFIWDAWLAVTIQLHLLESDKEVFPCQWMKQIFYAESLVNIENVRCLLLGQDPVSKPNQTIGLTDLRKATGIAFHAIGNDNSSIEGMNEHYGLNCFDDGPIDLCKNGRLLVNMIRCIGRNDYSVSNNSCRGAWISYTLKLAHFFTNELKKPVIVFCKFPAALPEVYMPTACASSNLTRVPHPAYVRDSDKEDCDKVKEILANL